MKLYILCAVIGVVLTNLVTAQTTSPIITDRPDQTESPFLVPQWHVQVETGIQQGADRNMREIDLPTVLGRIGITEFMELRIGGANTMSYSTGNDPLDGANTPSFFIGMKSPIYKGEKGITHISFMGHLGIEKNNYTLQEHSAVTPDFRFAVQHSLTESFSISYNAGCMWDGYSTNPAYIYTYSNAYALTNKLGCFGELYGQFSEESYLNQHHADAGITYLLRDQIQLDISGGIGLNESAQDWFLSCGVSFRVPN